MSTSFKSFIDIYSDFNKFSFIPRIIPVRDSTAAMFSLFSELGMVTRWRVARDCLARFILMVRRGYRDPPYHNWVHGFTVAHSAYLLLHNSNLLERGVISDLEAFALLIANLKQQYASYPLL